MLRYFFNRIFNATVSLSILLAMSTVGSAFAGDNEIKFELTDNPGRWIDRLPLLRQEFGLNFLAIQIPCIPEPV